MPVDRIEDKTAELVGKFDGLAARKHVRLNCNKFIAADTGNKSSFFEPRSNSTGNLLEDARIRDVSPGFSSRARRSAQG